jgi:DNA polymerase I
MLISQLLWPDRPGGHSLRAWGERVGSSKIDFHDWSLGESAEMVEYCRQDVRLTGLVLRELQAEAARMDRRGGGSSWKTALDTEHRVRAIMNDVEAAGYMLDVATASALVARLMTEIADIEADVLAEMVPLPKAKRAVTPKYKKDGTLSTVGLKHLGDDWESCGGDHTAIDWVVFNLGSRQQIGERLIREGWRPTRFTEQGQPMVDEGTLSGIDLPLSRKISRYLMLQKRVSQITSWMDKVDDDSRVRCHYRTLGAITHRMSCNTPNLQQVPGPQSEYGAECRSCWTVPAGRQLIGTDLAGIELRCLAHYLNDQKYTEELIHGDVHTRTQELAGLPDRAGAKTFTYALLYGAGDAKLGTIVGGGAADGAAIRARYLRNMPSFANLQRSVTDAARTGFIRGIDDRVLRIRSEHAALNTLLQSCAAVVAKRWLIRIRDLLDESGLDAPIIAMIHDELCIEAAGSVDPSVIGEMSKTAVRQAEADLNFNCPLDCDWKVGHNWSETH